MSRFDARAAEESEAVAAGGRVGDGFYGRRVSATQRLLPAGAALACAQRGPDALAPHAYRRDYPYARYRNTSHKNSAES